MLGAGATAGALAGLSPQRATAVLKLDVTSGNVQPIPIAVPDFVSVATQDPAAGRNVSQIIASNLQRSGLFAPIDQAAYIEKISDHRHAAPLCRLAASQRASARHRASHAGRWPAQG